MKSQSFCQGVWFMLILLIAGRSLPAIAQHDIDSLIHANMEAGDIPGLSVVIIRGGEEIIRTFGYADAARKREVTPQTLFELASCTKAFTALAILDLATKGRLSMQEPVSRYLPWLEVYYNNRVVEITIGQLLHHTSGIPWTTIADIPQGEDAGALRRTVETLRGIALKNMPGTQFEYATVNYDVLGLIIETVTGTSYEKYMTENIITPLGLRHTFTGRENVPHNADVALGYKSSFFKAREYQAPLFRGNNPAGYVVSDAADMARWLKIQMGLIRNDFTGLIHTAHQRDASVAPFQNNSYGMGWQISLWGDGVIYHEGLNPNYTSFIGFIPGKQIGVVLLANSNSSYTRYMGNQLLYFLDGKKLPAEINPEAGPDKSFSVISVILMFYLAVVFVYLGYILYGVWKGKRKYQKPARREIITFAWVLCVILPCLLGVYWLPQAYNNFSWEAIGVWAPGSFIIMIALVLLAAALSCIAYGFSTFFPDSSKFMRVIPQTVVISILSGIANMVLILLITSSVGTQASLKFTLFYFGLTIMIYISGRSYVQRKLIGFTRNLVHEIRMSLISKILSTSYQKFEKIEKGRVLATVNGDIYVIGNVAYMAIALATSLITVAGAFFYLASIAFWATMVTLALVASISLLYYVVSKRTRPLFEQARDTGNVLMNFMSDLLNGYKEISLGRQKKLEFRKDISGTSEEFKTKMTRAETNFVYAFLIGESLLIMVLGISAFALPLMFPEIKLYVLMSFIIILLYLIGPVNGILRSIPEALQFRIAWNRVQSFIKEIPSDLHIDEPLTAVVPVTVESFSVEDISFSYEREGAPAFKVGPVSFELNSGEILFIAGGNGSGKSTLAKLLTGLYKPDSGTVMINGVPVSPAEAGEYFSAIFSPVHLFKKIYAVNAGERAEEISQYLDELELSHKVSIDNLHFNTLQLSNGQLKRLALLQCYLEDKPIYLFDEWAADQDPEYRKFFYRNLLPKMKEQNKIIIAITHDDHYFDVADRILKMNLGRMEFLKVKPRHELVS